MKNTLNQQQVDQVVELFKKYITIDTDPDKLAQTLDEVIISYACYLVDDAERNGYQNRSHGLFILHELKGICQGKKEVTLN